MSRYTQNKLAMTVPRIQDRKSRQEKITMVTCYDAAFARLVELSGMDMVLVGDSVGNVMLGYDDTTRVTMDQMVHHTAAVSRVLKTPLLVADMPFLSYQTSVDDAVRNAGRLVQEGGAQAVKLEGGRRWVSHIEAIVAAGIPVMGHLGLTPQSVHVLGGYRVQGRDGDAQKRLMEDARALQDAGCFSLVMELVPAALAERVTKSLQIPTIGIGAGAATDGQVLVLQDLLGFDPEFRPKFLKTYADLGTVVTSALQRYAEDVRSGQFPGPEHQFD